MNVVMSYPNWTPIILRKPTEDELESHPNWDEVAENVPCYDEEVLVSDGKYIWIDTMLYEDGEVWWDNYCSNLEDTAWMPLPPVWKKDEDGE